MKSITILGRRWFQKSAGNTYHTVQVLIDGELKFQSERTYGYGNQYVDTACDWLEQNGYYLNGKEPIWSVCEQLGIKLHYSCADVDRKRDL